MTIQRSCLGTASAPARIVAARYRNSTAWSVIGDETNP